MQSQIATRHGELLGEPGGRNLNPVGLSGLRPQAESNRTGLHSIIVPWGVLAMHAFRSLIGSVKNDRLAAEVGQKDRGGQG